MWAFASLPVKTDELEKLLEFYPDRSIDLQYYQMMNNLPL
jgi:hypothetical protein